MDNDIERIRVMEEHREIQRVELSEIRRFHIVQQCPECGKELDTTAEGDTPECGCDYFIPVWERAVLEHTVYGDRTADGRVNWGQRFHNPFAAVEYTDADIDEQLLRYRQWLVEGWTS